MSRPFTAHITAHIWIDEDGNCVSREHEFSNLEEFLSYMEVSNNFGFNSTEVARCDWCDQLYYIEDSTAGMHNIFCSQECQAEHEDSDHAINEDAQYDPEDS